MEKYKDIGLLLFLLSPFSIFLVDYEKGSFFISIAIFLVIFFGFVYFIITIWEEKLKHDNDDDGRHIY